MIVFDANVVIALHLTRHPRHEVATTWFHSLCERGERFAVPAIAWHALIRIMTNRRAVGTVSTLDELFAFVDTVRGYSGYRVVDGVPDTSETLRRLCLDADVSGNLVTDAVIAAIAVEHGAAVASFDRDFARFPGLRWIVPGE